MKLFSCKIVWGVPGRRGSADMDASDFIMETRTIYKLGFHQTYYTSSRILEIKIVMRS